jgi:hypothetical protein
MSGRAIAAWLWRYLTARNATMTAVTPDRGSEEVMVLRSPYRFLLALSIGVFALIGFAMLADPASDRGVRIAYGMMGTAALILAIRALWRRIILTPTGVVQVRWLSRRSFAVASAQPVLGHVLFAIVGTWSIRVETTAGGSLTLDELSAPALSLTSPPSRLEQACRALNSKFDGELPG